MSRVGRGRRRGIGAAAWLLALAVLAECATAGPRIERQRGISWVAGRMISGAALDPVAALGADWIAQTPFGWMSAADDPSIGLVTGGRVLWGETDDGLVATLGMARERGLKCALKPHLWVRGAWPGAVAMPDAAAWQQWFAAYERFILHYAELAARERFDMLVVGTELKEATRGHGDEWRRIIGRVRAVYDGPLTYAANWDEFEHVDFWPALDAIGVNAYFPLEVAADGASVGRIAAAWKPYAMRLASLSRAEERPVILTEIGYRATADCLARPWEHDGVGDDPGCQERALAGMFTALWDEPWLAGVYVWKWFPSDPGRPRTPRSSARRRHRRAAFSPQGRPAEAVIRKWYGRGVAAVEDPPAD